MSQSKPFSVLRWLIALAALGGMLFLLMERAPDSQPASDTPAVAQAPDDGPADTATEVFGSPLPALSSLEELDLDTPPARRGLDLQHWQTRQGTPVYFMHAGELPMLDIQLLYAAGASRHEGTHHLEGALIGGEPISRAGGHGGDVALALARLHLLILHLGLGGEVYLGVGGEVKRRRL